MTVDIDITKDLSLWTDEEKNAFVDIFEMSKDFGDSLTHEEYQIYEKIIKERGDM